MNGRSPIAVKVDNLIRSKLRVSNPNDPAEIADGLKRFYKGAAELTRLEESGLPFYQVPDHRTAAAGMPQGLAVSSWTRPNRTSPRISASCFKTSC